MVLYNKTTSRIKQKPKRQCVTLKHKTGSNLENVRQRLTIKICVICKNLTKSCPVSLQYRYEEISPSGDYKGGAEKTKNSNIGNYDVCLNHMFFF